eukprot:scaffold161326_cov85-Cyclotella_meneghiniana.AAC.1
MTKSPSKTSSKKLIMSANFASPIKKSKMIKQTWGNFVDVYETLVSPIVIIVCTRMDKPEGSYITPMVKAFKDDESGSLSNKWGVITFLSRCEKDTDTKKDTNGGERNAMLKGLNSHYEWEAIVGFIDRTKGDVKEVGINIAKEFSSFSKSDRQVRYLFLRSQAK